MLQSLVGILLKHLLHIHPFNNLRTNGRIFTKLRANIVQEEDTFQFPTINNRKLRVMGLFEAGVTRNAT